MNDSKRGSSMLPFRSRRSSALQNLPFTKMNSTTNKSYYVDIGLPWDLAQDN